MTARYAIYFCPDTASDFYRLGADWLGYDAAAGVETVPSLPDGIAGDEWRAATEAPRRYGFHATLKPPFHLAEGAEAGALRDAVAAFAAAWPPVEAGPLAVDLLDGFVALTLADGTEEVSALAAACVEAFDGFRAPADMVELDARRAAGLTAHQETLLRRWGYPFVMDAFRFHMTLTGRLDEARRERFRAALSERFAGVTGRPYGIESLCLFVQPSAESRFEFRERFALGG